MKGRLNVIGRFAFIALAFLTFCSIGCDDSTQYETPKPSRFQRTVIGNWEGTGGVSAAFGRDGTFEMDSLVGVCKIYGTYNVSDYSDGTYLLENITHLVGSCDPDAKPGRGREKLDILSSDHILIGPIEFTRSQ